MTPQGGNPPAGPLLTAHQAAVVRELVDAAAELVGQLRYGLLGDEASWDARAARYEAAAAEACSLADPPPCGRFVARLGDGDHSHELYCNQPRGHDGWIHSHTVTTT